MKTELLCIPSLEKSHQVWEQAPSPALAKQWQTLPPYSLPYSAHKGQGSARPLWSLAFGEAQSLEKVILFPLYQGGKKSASLCCGLA